MGILNRRDFIKSSGGLAAACVLSSSPKGYARPKGGNSTVRIGIVGTGGRCRGLLRTMLKMSGMEIPAICDVDRKALQATGKRITNAGWKRPDEYCKDDYTYRELMARDDIDAVIITTPWRWHAPMAIDCMKAGKYAGVEVPAALTIEECHELVSTSEKTGVPCMMLENWSFRRDNLAVLNMIRKGLFGEIVHCHCAHSHDCIDHWFFDKKTGKDRWPAEYLLKYNRDQYPTHSLGPVLSWMDLGCGDYFDYITSTATGSFGINDMFVRRFGPDHPGAKRKYAQGDIVTTVVKTKKGKSIVINYDMQLPRPYDNRWMIQGTRGIYSESKKSVCFANETPKSHPWKPFAPYQEKYEHKWWKQKIDGDHEGTDYLELQLFADAVRNKKQTPIDVYDSVLFSCIVPLSGQSIAKGGAPVKVPDFTRGKWKTNKPTFGVEC